MPLTDIQKRKALELSGYNPDEWDIDDLDQIIPKTTLSPPITTTPPNPLTEPLVTQEPTNTPFQTGLKTFAEEAPSALGAAAGAGLGLKLSAPAYVGGPLVGGAASLLGVLGGAALGGFATRKLQQEIEPEEWQQAVALAQQENPLAAKAGALATLPLSGFKVSPKTLITGVGGLPKLLAGQTRIMSAEEVAALRNIGYGGAIGAASPFAHSAITGELPSPEQIGESALLGLIFNEPNIIGRKLGFKPTFPLRQTLPDIRQAAPIDIESAVQQLETKAPPSPLYRAATTASGAPGTIIEPVKPRLKTGVGTEKYVPYTSAAESALHMEQLLREGVKPELRQAPAIQEGIEAELARQRIQMENRVRTLEKLQEGQQRIVENLTALQTMPRQPEMPEYALPIEGSLATKPVPEQPLTPYAEAVKKIEEKGRKNVENIQFKIRSNQALREQIAREGGKPPKFSEESPLMRERDRLSKQYYTLLDDLSKKSKIPIIDVTYDKFTPELKKLYGQLDQLNSLLYNEPRNSEESPLTERPQTELEKDVKRQLDEKGISARPTDVWTEMIKIFGKFRGILVKEDGTIINPATGKSIAGMTTFDKALQKWFVTLHPKNQRLDTAAHEMAGHAFFEALRNSPHKVDRDFVRNFENLVSQHPDFKAINEFRTSQNLKPWDAEEFIATQQGLEFVRRQLNLSGENAFKTYWHDLWSYIKTRFNSKNATEADYRRILQYRFQNDPAFHDYFKTGIKITEPVGALSARSLLSDERQREQPLMVEGGPRTPADTLEANRQRARVMLDEGFITQKELDRIELAKEGETWPTEFLDNRLEDMGIERRRFSEESPLKKDKPIAPAKFLAMMPDEATAAKYGTKRLRYYNLTQDIEGHPKDDTVSENTLRRLGYRLPDEGEAGTKLSEESPLREQGELFEKREVEPPSKFAKMRKGLEDERVTKEADKYLRREAEIDAQKPVEEPPTEFSEESPLRENKNKKRILYVLSSDPKAQLYNWKEKGKLVYYLTSEKTGPTRVSREDLDFLESKGYLETEEGAAPGSTYWKITEEGKAFYTRLAPSLTPADVQYNIMGEPKGKAVRTREGTLVNPIWEYRGFKMQGRKRSGWESGSDWRGTKGETGIMASSKFELMHKIDKFLDVPSEEKYSEESPLLTDKQKDMLRKYTDAVKEVSFRTKLGLRPVVAESSGYISSWSNAQGKWYVHRQKTNKGEELKLDANQIFIPGNKIDVEVIAKHLQDLPLFADAAENNPLLKLPPDASPEDVFNAIRNWERPKSVDLVKKISKFLDVVREPILDPRKDYQRILAYENILRAEEMLDKGYVQDDIKLMEYWNKKLQSAKNRFDELNKKIIQYSEESLLLDDRRRYSFAPFLTGRIDKIAEKIKTPAAQYAVPKLHAFSKELDILTGRIGNKMIAASREYSPDEIQRVYRYAHQIDDTGKSTINLNGREQKLANAWKTTLQEVRQLQNKLGLKVKQGQTYRAGGMKPEGYMFNILDPEVAYVWAEKPDSAQSKNYDKAYLNHLKRKGLSETEAAETLHEYKESLGSNITRDIEFGAIRRAEGMGLPWELVDKNFASAAIRYARRAARDLAYYKWIQSDVKMRKALNVSDQYGVLPKTTDAPEFSSIARATETKEALRSVFGIDQPRNPTAMAAARSAANTIMGVGTAARNILNMPAFIASYVQLKQMPLVAKAISHMSDSRIRAFQNNAVRASYHDFDAAGYYMGSPNPAIRLLNKYSAFMRRYQGRDLSDKFEGEFYYSLGELLATDNIARAKTGNKESRQFVEKFATTVEGGAERLLKAGSKVSQDDIERMAKSFVDSTRGTYSEQGLPSWAIEGEFAPFAALSRFSIEKSNTIWKDVIEPARQGVYGPLLRYILGSAGVGYLVEELNELLTNKRGVEPTISEVLDSGDPEDLIAKAISTAQLASFAGIVSDGAQLVSNLARGKGPSYRQPLTFPLYTLVSDTLLGNISGAAQAINEGEDPFEVLAQLVTAISTQAVQTARYVDANVLRPEEAKRKEKFRDYNIWQEMTDRREPLGDIGRSSEFKNLSIKEFKREEDIGEAVEQLPDLISRAFDKSTKNGILNVEKLRSELTKIKQNSYQTMPSPDNMPEGFLEYLGYLNRTQGEEAAQERLVDYITRREINKAKASLVPTI